MPAITNVYLLILAHLEIETAKYPYAPFPGNKGSLGFILMVYHFHEFSIWIFSATSFLFLTFSSINFVLCHTYCTTLTLI